MGPTFRLIAGNRILLLFCRFSLPEHHPVGPSIRRDLVLGRVGGRRTHLHRQTALNGHPVVVVFRSPGPGVTAQRAGAFLMSPIAIEPVFGIDLLVRIVAQNGRRTPATSKLSWKRELIVS